MPFGHLTLVHMIADLLWCVRTTDTVIGVAFVIALGIQKGFLTRSGCPMVLELSARWTGQSHETTSRNGPPSTFRQLPSWLM